MYTDEFILIKKIDPEKKEKKKIDGKRRNLEHEFGEQFVGIS